MKKYLLALPVGVALGLSPLGVMAASAEATNIEKIMQELEALKQRVETLQGELEKERARNDEIAQAQKEQAQLEQARKESAEQVVTAGKEAESTKPDIRLGGAVRFNYTVNENDEDQKDRGGDMRFDTVRLGFDGEIDDVILSAEWRWYEYMSVIHHAWVGYEFSDDLNARAGIFQIPFGVLPYNSHSFYFSSMFYVGLEDNYDFGVGSTYTPGDWRLDLAFLKNDERGGSSPESYSANVIGYDGDRGGTEAVNSLAARAEYDYTVGDNLSIKPGASFKYGQLNGGRTGSDGDYYAAAAHLVADYDRWNLQLQYSDWKYDLDDSAAEFINYGYYNAMYTGPLSARAVTANIAYTMPVNWGPISSLRFYNDYSLIFDKNNDYKNTYMNVTGMSVGAGGVYAYFDIINGKNQPFVSGGTAALTGEADSNTIYNINIGYYF